MGGISGAHIYLIENDIACYRSLIDWIANKKSKIIQKRWTKANKADIYRDKYRVITQQILRRAHGLQNPGHFLWVKRN